MSDSEHSLKYYTIPYDGGSIHGQLKDDHAEGVWTVYDEDDKHIGHFVYKSGHACRGVLKSDTQIISFNYSDGEYHGKYKSKTLDGLSEITKIYHRGTLTGCSYIVDYNSIGQIIQHTEFETTCDGDCCLMTSYLNGKKINKTRFIGCNLLQYNEYIDGKLSYLVLYDGDNKLLSKEFNHDGSVKNIIKYDHDQPGSCDLKVNKRFGKLMESVSNKKRNIDSIL
jgi:hypothetical protein